MIESVVGFITALLAGLGIGGGGLLVIYLVLWKNCEQLLAQGINLLFFLFSSSAAMVVHFRKRRIPLLFVALISCIGIVGALLGSSVAKAVSPGLVRIIFGLLLIASGTISLFR